MTAEVAKKELERLQNLFKREPFKGAPLNLSRSRDKSVGEAAKLTPDDALTGVWCLVDLPAGISAHTQGRAQHAVRGLRIQDVRVTRG